MSHKKVLLLRSNYEISSFITEERAIKLLYKEKVKVISSWENEYITHINGKINLPAILVLEHHTKKPYYDGKVFSRKALVKRDKSCCQYCGRKLTPSEITMDHVKPRAQGGVTSFSNCVVACQPCNNKKADRTPEEANMHLIKKPTHPSFGVIRSSFIDYKDYWHEDWDDYLTNV